MVQFCSNISYQNGEAEMHHKLTRFLHHYAWREMSTLSKSIDVLVHYRHFLPQSETRSFVVFHVLAHSLRCFAEARMCTIKGYNKGKGKGT